MKLKSLIFTTAVIAASCSNHEKKSDAYGSFETTEITISSEANGKLLYLNVCEGQELSKDTPVGQVDTIDLYLKTQQLKAQAQAISKKTPNVSKQADVQKQQKENLLVEKSRFEKLLKDGAATQKQLDDINAALNLVDKQIESIEVQNGSTQDEINAIEKQIAQVEESIKKCKIKNPVKGTVLTKYMEPNEIAIMGKALYKIADMNEMYLKVYVSGEQLPGIKLGQKVQVLVDKNAKENQQMEGAVSWISQQAEFTPKIIQTKEERVNLVYAVKILVKNNGTLKIGMPGEANFSSINEINTSK
ncbi:MAG: HlyD family efflux transporter periplasmic adaptor subunit [Bacteroidia bacterium]|nr:HlyD family efflux transporter periplasmic adaptor subunit [Bacteroidia bacterium]